MSKWKKSVRESLRSISKSYENNLNDEQIRQRVIIEEKLQYLFLGIKKILSFLLKIATVEEQVKSQQEFDLNKSIQDLKDIDLKLFNEILLFNEISINYAFLFKESKQVNLNFARLLNRRVKMLLRLVIPMNTEIKQKTQSVFIRIENCLKFQNYIDCRIDQMVNFRDLGKKYESKFLFKEDALKNQNYFNNLQLNRQQQPVPIYFFFNLVDILLNQIFVVQKNVLTTIKKKKKENDPIKNNKNTPIDSDKHGLVSNHIVNTKYCLKNKYQIDLIHNLLKSSIYNIMNIDKVDVFDHAIPGVQYSTNQFLNFDKQKKRNKRIKKDIQNYYNHYQFLLTKKNKGKYRIADHNFNIRCHKDKSLPKRYVSEGNKRSIVLENKTKNGLNLQSRKDIKSRGQTFYQKQRTTFYRSKTNEKLIQKVHTNNIKITRIRNVIKPLKTNNLKLR